MFTAEPAPVPAVPELDSEGDQLADRVGKLLAAQTPRARRGDTEVTQVVTSESDGVRETVISGKTVLHFPATPSPGAMAANGSVDDLISTFQAGLGRVTDVTADRRSQAEYLWTVKLSSRTGWDVEHPAIEGATVYA